MKPLVVIPARGGSKGLPGKNIKLLKGKPLILYTVEVARSNFIDDVICVSTDDQKIRSTVEECGLKVPFIRPLDLASDASSMYDVLLHALDSYKSKGYVADTVILLQPTSPFRTERHLKEALSLYDSTCEMVVSVCETKANPYFLLKEENEEGWLVNSKKADFVRRQDCPKVYQLNGAIYIINVEILRAKALNEFNYVKKYVMDKFSSIDIDDDLDWVVAESVVDSKFNLSF